MTMQTKIQKSGDSLWLSIPKPLAKEAGVGAGSKVDLAVQNGELIVRPVRRVRYTLKELLSGVTPANIHLETNTEQPVGREVW